MIAGGENLDPASARMMLQAMGPHAIDQQIRQAISLCWMLLPEEKKSVEAVEAEIRRLVDRALKDLREDAAAFGVPKSEPPAPGRAARRARPAAQSRAPSRPGGEVGR